MEKKSNYWIKSFMDVAKNPYSYEDQNLFLEEALKILDEVYKHYDEYQLKFHIDDESIEKAIWMLHLDALDTLRDCIFLLKKKKHRIVGKMFRDITEILDLSALFWWERNEGSSNLKRWYKNKIVQHSEFRKYLKKTKGEYERKYSADMYSSLSQWIHHTYFTLKNSYSLGADDMLVYDGHSESLILPQTISQYIYEIKDLTLYFLYHVRMVGMINWEEIAVFINKTIKGLEINTTPNSLIGS